MIGDKDYWPAYVKKAFWCSKFNYKDRLIICTFAWGNGLPIDVLIEFFWYVNNGYFTKSVENKIRGIFETFEKSDRVYRARRTYFDTTVGYVLDFNGDRPGGFAHKGVDSVRKNIPLKPSYIKGCNYD